MHIVDLHHDQQHAMAVKVEDCGFKYDKGELTPETSWKTLEPHWMDGWMNGVLGYFYALSRLNWAWDNLG